MSVSGVHQMLDTSVPPPSGGGKKSFCGIRSSKFKHVYGAPAKKSQCYDNIKITRNAGDANFCAANPKVFFIRQFHQSRIPNLRFFKRII